MSSSTQLKPLNSRSPPGSTWVVLFVPWPGASLMYHLALGSPHLFPLSQGPLVLLFVWFLVLFFAFFLATLRGMWDLSSLTRDWTHAPCGGSMESYTTGPPGNSQGPLFLLTDAQCLTSCCFIYSVHFLVVLDVRVSQVPVTPFWPEVGIWHLLSLVGF